MPSTKHSLEVIISTAPVGSTKNLLKELHGEFLLIRSPQIIWICNRSAKNMRTQSMSWLEHVAQMKNARFMVGRLTNRGGRFQNISRDAAIELIAHWVFDDL